MPVINAAYTTYDSVYLPIPTEADPDSLTWTWGSPYRFLVASISTKQVATFDFDTTTLKGDPRGTIWSVGDAVWQVDVTIPFLVPEPTFTTNRVGATTASFPTTFTEPYCANLPVVSNGAFPLAWYVYAAMRSKLGPMTSSTGMWETFWKTTSPAREPDIIIQQLSVEVKEGRATLTLSLLCTEDPRSKFMIKQGVITNTSGYRAAAPYDFMIPSGEKYLGSLIAYEGGYGMNAISERKPWASGNNHGFVREWGFTIKSQVTRFKSVGTPSARPLLGVSATTCEGNLKYIPITQVGTGAQIIDSSIDTDRLPIGWIVDRQVLDTVDRAGGQLYITGQPPYTGTRQPIYLAMNMRKGDTIGGATYTLIGQNDLGPIGVAVASFDASGGSENTVSIDFKTLVGVTEDEFMTLTTAP